MARKSFSTDEWNMMKQMRVEGMTYAEIADAVGRTTKSVQMRFCNQGLQKPRVKRTAPVQAAQVAETKKVTLADFSPRDMIKYLYELGYRIEGSGKLVYIQKKYVKISDVVGGK